MYLWIIETASYVTDVAFSDSERDNLLLPTLCNLSPQEVVRKFYLKRVKGHLAQEMEEINWSRVPLLEEE